MLLLKLSAQRNETETKVSKLFLNCCETVLFRFHFVVSYSTSTCINPFNPFQ